MSFWTAFFCLTVVTSPAQGKDDGSSVVICLDPGHPSYPGDKLYEAMLNRKVAYFLKDCLIGAGHDVVVSVEDIDREALFKDDFDMKSDINQSKLQVVGPEERAKICKDRKSDFVVSIHHNYAYDETTNHALVLYAEDETYTPYFEKAELWSDMTADKLGEAMEVTNYVSASDQDALGGSLILLRSVDAIGIMTEASFYSNPEERKRLEDDGYLNSEALAICEAFTRFKTKALPDKRR